MSEQIDSQRQLTVADNPGESRLEARVNGHVAFVAYIRNGNTVILTHTEVPKELQGHGVGNSLARGAFDYARSAGWNVVVRCPFLTKFIERHPEYRPARGAN